VSESECKSNTDKNALSVKFTSRYKFGNEFIQFHKNGYRRFNSPHNGGGLSKNYDTNHNLISKRLDVPYVVQIYFTDRQEIITDDDTFFYDNGLDYQEKILYVHDPRTGRK
jgi:hypothetical protein